ncbi:MAG: hypothetical protein FWF55_00095 [Treponema sp.]|nr:hypothetical protein [Treponema sp.]
MSEPDMVKEWFRYAHNDLTVAKHCFEDLHPKNKNITPLTKAGNWL